ncbi:CatA-like O-acetyltransferase [Sabulilitoribacter multivorans]|uniref:CatA-like O-acetyltransferase n=1 Tax=Flaviramulus multivorans TaxID=1304750 RepID=A0ABS9IJ93_9FLAO|nr:CatA-like O-acetyltransferase [Flaviramulus multivorans]MCF7560660.1 CatA-like O-acetyltransferase [Flaviramulus multivorans]
MRIIDLNTWNRKRHFEHFSALSDPYFAITLPFNVTKAYNFSKENGISFFAKYLHDCMRAINSVDNLKYRIENNNVVEYDFIHASPTIMRSDNTYGFSFINYDEDLHVFIKNIESEKNRINNTDDLYPPKNGLDCIHCSAMPWFNFSSTKEPVSGILDSVPKIAFSKATTVNNELIMNVSINVNHALVDGYHIGLFSEKFQSYLNQ